MSEIKLIVTDLDGTFLMGKNVVSEENKAAIAAARKKGHSKQKAKSQSKYFFHKRPPIDF